MRDLLLLSIVIALIPCIWKYPWTGVLAWFWVGLMVPQGHTWNYMQTFPLAVVIGAVTMVALVVTNERKPLPVTREVILMFLFAGHMALTSAFAVNSTGAWDQWQNVMKILLMTFVTPMLVFGSKRIIWVLLVVAGSLAFYGVKGGVFTITTGGSYMVLGPQRSFLSGNTYIGLAMIMVLPLILVSARLFRERWVELGWPIKPHWYGPIGLGLYACFWLTALAIIATYSRGAWLGLLAVAPLLFLRMRRKVLMVLLALFAVGVVGVAAPERMTQRWETIGGYEDDTSAMQRIQAWGVSWNMAIERPVFGMGFRYGRMGYDWWVSYANFEGHWQHVLSPHSIYFQVLAQHGFVGIGLFLSLIGFTYLTLGRIKRTGKANGIVWLSQYAWAMQVGLLGYLVAGAFLDVAYFNLLYAFIALAIIMRRQLDESSD